ncbi:t-complex 1 subunit alpha [Apiospora arundinis]
MATAELHETAMMTTEKQSLSVDSASLDSPAAPAEAAVFDAKLCAKLDFRILTPMFFLNFLSLMGRTNIGAALIQKLPVDLKMDAMKTFLAISMPVVMLILFEVPSNLLMRWFDKRYGLSYMRYLSLITVGLGVVTLGQAFDKSYGALLATRFLVGIFDAGLMPGCVFVLSLYYPSVHLQWRLSMLMVSNIISNIISNILAFGIAQIRNTNSISEWSGWRWIFLIEGLLTIAIGLICVWSDVGRPEKAPFLSAKEKMVIDANVESRKSAIGLAAEVQVFLAFHREWTVPQIQGQVVPIFVVAAALCLVMGWAADRTNHRCGFALFGYIVTMTGYAILRETDRFSPSVQLLGLYFVCMGTYTSLTMVWALTCLNSATPFQKAFGSAFVIGVGNVGGFISAWIFRSSEAPHYTAGMTDGLILTCVAAGLTVFAWCYIVWHNTRNVLGAKESGIDSLKTGRVKRLVL